MIVKLDWSAAMSLQNLVNAWSDHKDPAEKSEIQSYRLYSHMKGHELDSLIL